MCSLLGENVSSSVQSVDQFFFAEFGFALTKTRPDGALLTVTCSWVTFYVYSMWWYGKPRPVAAVRGPWIVLVWGGVGRYGQPYVYIE